VHGQPDESPFVLMPGRQIDRLGSEYGAFLAPTDTLYAERSLPPQRLDNFDPAYTCNYPSEREFHDAVMGGLEQQAGVTLEGMRLADVAGAAARVFAGTWRPSRPPPPSPGSSPSSRPPSATGGGPAVRAW
jgi:hypothetical protein